MSEEVLNLIKIRVVSFLMEAGVYLLGTLLTALVSPAFQQIVTEHYGTGIVATVILLTVTGVVKHLRNLAVLKDMQLGGRSEQDVYFI